METDLARAVEVLPVGRWDPAVAADRVTLDYDARHRRRFRFVAAGGAEFLLDLDRAVVLGDGDGLVLDDGRVVAVSAADEPLMEVRAANAGELMRLAWHIGNRHLPAQLAPDGIRLRRDHVIAAMLRGLGAQVREIEAPFTPEAGAYAPEQAAHSHDHGHHHNHGHHHDH